MANILKTIIENDKGELRRLEKMADKVLTMRAKWLYVRRRTKSEN